MTINTMMLLLAVWVLVAIVLSLVIARVFGAASRADAEARRKQAEKAMQSAMADDSVSGTGRPSDSSEPHSASGGK
jgi:flagellar biosynthesis/type III secretory pathway M-ring protein FliF/YscJ